MKISLRTVEAKDQEFLFQLYASTREAEVALFGWDTARQQTFLRMQFAVQRQWYDAAYAAMENWLILRDGEPVGRLAISRTTDEIRLVDISLLTAHRNSGIGTILIRQLLQEGASSRRPVLLQVLKTNRARHLYERLGFVNTGEDETHFQMQSRLA